MGCDPPTSSPPPGPLPAPCGDGVIFLRDIWWQDSTIDGGPVDNGDDSQAGFPFADQYAQSITPRTLRNFAYEISKALCTLPHYLIESGSLLENLAFYIGDGTNGEEGHFYYTTEHPTPPTAPGMAGWTDAGNFGELAGAMPAGGEPGQVLVKTATDNYAVEWTDWCNELNLTPNMFLLENRLVDAIPYLTEQSPPNDPPLWMSDYGMNATQGSIATLPAEGSRTSDYFAQAFQINWPADSQAQGTYASVEQDPHYLQYFFTFTADAPGSLEILLAGVDGEELTGSVEAVVTPTDTSDVSWDPDPYHQYIIGYGSTGSLGEGGGVPITEPTEYSVRIRYSPGANIRQHLPYDDPSLELLFQQPTGELSVTYESFDALGKTGEVYDQGLSDIDACYGTDLHRIITETIQRVPTKPLVYGAALFGDESPIDQIIATRSKLLYFGTPFGIRHDESTGGLRINGQYTYYNTTSELLVVTQGLVRDLPGFSSRAATHPIWAGVWVTLRLEDAEFNQDLALSAKLELFLMKNALDPPEPVAERTVMVPAAGAWQLPTTAFLVGEVYGDSESLTKLALGWHVRVTLTDPTLDPTLQDKRLIVDWMTASPQMDGL